MRFQVQSVKGKGATDNIYTSKPTRDTYCFLVDFKNTSTHLIGKPNGLK